jgi:2-polyprenyl-3-methyl-5-hydroxy-6-metoxy-1,4-benzoquinol methylase
VSDPNLVMEEPALLDELGSVEGLRVADLGCGDAALGRVLLSGGCARYLAIDGSERMVAAARETLRGTAGEVERGDIEDFAAPTGAFDLVVSRMALHYVEDVERVLSACHSCLSPGGRIVFTRSSIRSSPRTTRGRARRSCARAGSSTLFLLLAGARR